MVNFTHKYTPHYCSAFLKPQLQPLQAAAALALCREHASSVLTKSGGRCRARKARYCDWFDDKCCFENFDKFWKNDGKYRCKICFQLQNSILILGNLAFIADCNLYFGQNLYNIFSLIPKCIRFSPQITDNSLFSLFMTVKIANNTGFNLYGKYRLVLRR